MKVKPIPSSEWENLNEQELSFVLTDLWKEASSDSYTRLGVYAGKGLDDLVAIFAIYDYQRMGKTVVIVPPAFPHCGLTMLKSYESQFKKQSFQKRVGRGIAEYFIATYPNAYVDIIFPEGFSDVQPFLQMHFEEKLSYTYLLNLSDSSEEALLGNMSPERRKNIRDGLKGELEVELSSDKAQVLELIHGVLSSQGVAFHEDLLNALLSSESENVFCVGVSRESKLLATAVIGLDAHSAYYIAGGALKSDTTAGTLALWTAIQETKRRGVGEFNFLGSSVPEIEKYFRGFGGELVPYFRVRRNTALLDFLKGVKQRIQKS